MRLHQLHLLFSLGTLSEILICPEAEFQKETKNNWIFIVAIFTTKSYSFQLHFKLRETYKSKFYHTYYIFETIWLSCDYNCDHFWAVFRINWLEIRIVWNKVLNWPWLIWKFLPKNAYLKLRNPCIKRNTNVIRRLDRTFTSELEIDLHSVEHSELKVRSSH